MIWAILGLLGTGAALLQSKKANDNINTINSLNEETRATIQPSLRELENRSNVLSSTLRETSNLKQRALIDYVDNSVYYLKHINSKITRKPMFDNEINQIISATKGYRETMNQLAIKKYDPNTMLVSTAIGSVVTGGALIGANAVGISASLGLGLCFFGTCSFILSAARLFQTEKALEEAQYLHANRNAIKSEIDCKCDIISQINLLCVNYNKELWLLLNQFGGELNTIQMLYKKGVVTSKRNIKLIAEGKQPELNFEDFSDSEQKELYAAVAKFKVVAEFARSQILHNDGSINMETIKMLGLKHE